MTDEVITELARLGDLTVISRTSVMVTYKGAKKRLADIAIELNVALAAMVSVSSVM